MEQELLVMKNINKSFPGVHALRDVSLSLRRGEVHALIGENGAGKSTLMKVLSGVHQADSGEILWEGKPVQIHSTTEATAMGISIIYQELNLMPNMSIRENIFLGRENRKARFFVDFQKTSELAKTYTDMVGLTADVNTLVKDLSIAQRQMVEVAKALSTNAKLIVMDEPTSSLTDRESRSSFSAVLASVFRDGSAMSRSRRHISIPFSGSSANTSSRTRSHDSSSKSSAVSCETSSGYSTNKISRQISS